MSRSSSGVSSSSAHTSFQCSNKPSSWIDHGAGKEAQTNQREATNNQAEQDERESLTTCQISALRKRNETNSGNGRLRPLASPRSGVETLTFSFLGEDFSLSTGESFLEFAYFIESDGDTFTDAIIIGDDALFVFERNSDEEITESVLLEGIIGDDGLVGRDLDVFNRFVPSVDVFAS